MYGDRRQDSVGLLAVMFLCQIIFSLHPHPVNLDLRQSVFLLSFKALLVSSGFKQAGALPLSHQPGYLKPCDRFFTDCASLHERPRAPERSRRVSSLLRSWLLESGVCTSHDCSVLYCWNRSWLFKLLWTWFKLCYLLLIWKEGQRDAGWTELCPSFEALEALGPASRQHIHSTEPVGDCQGQLSIDM